MRSAWSEPDELQVLLERLAQTASLSGRKLMASAGLSWQTLSSWKAGTRIPRPESLRALGQVLVLRGRRLIELGSELIQSAESEERRRAAAESPDTEPLPLFRVQSGDRALGSKRQAGPA